MSGDKERFLFEELMRGIEEMADERGAYTSIKQGLVEAIEAANRGVSITHNPTTKLYDVMDNGELICSTSTLPLAKECAEYWIKEILGGDNE